MAKDKYMACLDDTLCLISDDKLDNIVPFMVSQHASTIKKLGEDMRRTWLPAPALTTLWRAKAQCAACACVAKEQLLISPPATHGMLPRAGEAKASISKLLATAAQQQVEGAALLRAALDTMGRSNTDEMAPMPGRDRLLVSPS
jgi:hypothetical protein